MLQPWRRAAPLVLSMTFLASCSPEPSATLKDPYEGSEAVKAALPTAPPPNAASQDLLKMTEAERLGTFRGVVITSRGQCAAVTMAERRRQLDGADVWVIRCSDTGDWAVKVAADSTTRLLSCGFLARIGNPCETL